MAQASNISDNWFIGEDKAFVFTIYQENTDGTRSTEPQDITGWGLRWDLRKSASAHGTAILTKSTVDGSITITDGPNGVGSITIDSSDTDDLAARVYSHALKRTDTGSETVLLDGFAVLRRVTTR